MSFTTLVYHEIREGEMFDPDQIHSLEINQEYEDCLPSPLFITLENFHAQMEYLYKENFHTLTLNEIINYYYKGEDLPPKSVLLTFDDCYQSMKQYAYPLLKKYHFNAVSFVVTGWLNPSSKAFLPEKSVCLTTKDLEEMSDIFEYANHTDLFHTRTSQATSRMMEVSDEEFEKDLSRCNANPIVQIKNVFAYPFGLYEERNCRLLLNKGFLLAFTTKSAKNEKQTNPLLLNRSVIPFFMDMDVFRKIVD